MATANPTSYPLAGPQVSGDKITVSTLLAQPTRITRYLSDLSLRGFVSSRIFSTASGVSGGAVIYDQLTLNDLFPTRDVQSVGPGAEFPIVTSENQEPKVAVTEKFGGKFFVTDEAKSRNDAGVIQREGLKLINAITRKIDARAIKVLDDEITARSATQVMTGANWQNVVTGGASQSNASAWPAADFAKAQLLADQQELGVTFDLWLMNPAQLAQLKLVYGADYTSVLSSYGISAVASNRITAGTAYALVGGKVGELRLEKGLTTETWREEPRQITWVQSDVWPVMYVTDPYSVVKITGLAG